MSLRLHPLCYGASRFGNLRPLLGGILAIVAAIVAVLGTTAAVVAQRDSVSRVMLSWDAPASCPTAEAVDEVLRDAISPGGHTVGLSARVTRLEGALSMRLTTDGEIRTFTAPTCTALIDAMVLIVRLHEGGAAPAPANEVSREAVALPPETHERGAELAPPTSVDSDWRTQDPTLTSPPAREGEDPSPPMHLQLSLGLQMRLGTLPGVAFGPTLAIALTRGRFLGEVESVFLPSSTQASSAQPGTGGKFRLTGITTRACARAFGGPSGRWSLLPCTAVEIASVRGRGYGVSDPVSGRAPYAAAIFGVRVEVNLGKHFLATFATDLGFPFRRTRYVLGEIDVVHRAASADGRIAVQLAWRFL